MVERSRRNIFRRVVAPLAFVGALLLLAQQTCEAESSEIILRVQLGEARDKVSHLRLLVYRDGESVSVASFEHSYRSGPARPMKLKLSPGLYRLAFRVDTDTGVKRFDKRIHADGTATITVPIERELLAGQDGSQSGGASSK